LLITESLLTFLEIHWRVMSYDCNWMASTGFYGVWCSHG